MAFIELELTAEIRRALRQRWGLRPDRSAERLFGGEESAAFRVGERVVRVGPTWRRDEELQWSYSVAAEVAAHVPEVTAPVPHTAGGHLVRAAGRPVSVWPYVAGDWADPDNEDQRRQAAQLLARLHCAFSGVRTPPRRPSAPGPGHAHNPLLRDPALDRWMNEFYARHSRRHPLHGDYYRGNILVRDGIIVALVDWDDVLIGPPEQELAWAVREWTQRRRTTLDITAAQQFIGQYRAAGGTAQLIAPEELAQLIRDRIRREVTYSQAAGVWGVSPDPDDVAYEAGQLRAFHELRRI